MKISGGGRRRKRLYKKVFHEEGKKCQHVERKREGRLFLSEGIPERKVGSAEQKKKKNRRESSEGSNYELENLGKKKRYAKGIQGKTCIKKSSRNQSGGGFKAGGEKFYSGSKPGGQKGGYKTGRKGGRVLGGTTKFAKGKIIRLGLVFYEGLGGGRALWGKKRIKKSKQKSEYGQKNAYGKRVGPKAPKKKNIWEGNRPGRGKKVV